MIKICLLNLVEKLAKKKTITKHSKPWIDRKMAEKLAELRMLRKKFKRHKSMLNQKLYEEKREGVITEFEIAKEKWKVRQCESIAHAKSDKEKWKIINELTNTSVRMEVQPIRQVDVVTKEIVYLFEDGEILKEMENYHI